MGRPPAHVFVVRHGKRLDAADKQWHLTSPTPYDPPLTYAGWMQSKTVGARIASLIHGQVADAQSQPATPTTSTPPGGDILTPPKKKRYNIIIHSSPFLRCVQTSIAISAGIASNPPPEQDASDKSPAITRCVLRLDAFLGEWLSPDYFEHITPPPRSSLMLATAKAELLRREHYTDSPNILGARKPSGTQGQLWSPNGGQSGLEDLSGLKDSLPGAHQRTGSSLIRSLSPARAAYQSPVPTYAVGPNDPIPRGYVAHARDACADIDYQWDSSRDTIGWGDGGLLPEEWASMHQRFRRGFKRLVDWYATSDHPNQMVTKTTRTAYQGTAVAEPVEVDGDVDEENVVILVSHGAGCNALVGAITQQPVLADVAMSSISMAKRRPEFDLPNDIFEHRPASSLDDGLLRKKLTMQEVFDLKLFANTEHLHSAGSTPGVSRSSSLASHGRTLREITFSNSLGPGNAGANRSNSVNASLGSMRRGPGSPSLGPRPVSATRGSSAGITVGSTLSSLAGFSTGRNRSGSSGLWQPKNEEAIEDEVETPMLLNFSFEKDTKKEAGPTIILDSGEVSSKEFNLNTLASTSGSTGPKGTPTDESSLLKAEATDHFDEDVVPHLWAGTGNGGLWGAPRPPGEAERIRDHTSTKRRWTITERETIV
ncbi:uncharacterized protein B0I36DRAFT_243920 [Microdochium trichocladiopsis]|uniref:Histidine phosphatase superfamily n=1 Tax=Microdochium trichocladiopsis TaxID=1682393 RepID=A0A9P9BR71_9PEZI|nr:uncharacterized protein B0I36DRAFT_243920 [Microdochium trichocladiopsis]KAH7031637.1 hypothetical protein B0I36DRAFT_243920 [Microdochium trichocladiopsis]